MFRATAARQENRDCDYDESSLQISVELFNYDSVYKEDDQLVKVHDLQVGDIILLNEGFQKVYKQLIDIHPSPKDSCYSVLTFN